MKNSNTMSKSGKSGAPPMKRLLLVEDEGELSLAINLILSDRELEMDYVNSLLSADEYLKKYEPSIIILDNKLPDGFGVDFISYIKKKYPAIRIIMISGFGSARDVALANGADLFLEKPFSMSDVNDAIDKLLT
ncbi:MAG: response regulator [Bacteroidetes bacterium]|nr:response regulator [Bacteroidota bacterium]MBS1632535.1 response regulator [Bacteroidota bacterium]